MGRARRTRKARKQKHGLFERGLGSRKARRTRKALAVHPKADWENTMSAAAVVTPRPALAAWSLGQREIVRFLRQRNRIVGAIGTPVLFWLLFGAGFNAFFDLGG